MPHAHGSLLAAAMALAAAFALHARAQPIWSAPLKSTTLDDPQSVPFLAECRVDSGNASIDGAAATRVRELVQDHIVGEDKKGRLEVRVRRNATLPKRVDPTKPTVISIDCDGRKIPVLFYRKGDAWFYSSAAQLAATGREHRISFLDADLDGDHFGQNDMVRFDAATFRLQDGARLLALPASLGEYSVRHERSATYVDVVERKRPDWANSNQWAALGMMNAFRAGGGLAPRRLSEERSRACRLHAEYLFLNGDTSDSALGSSHDEVESNPGYTEQGDLAAHSSGISYTCLADRAVSEQAWTMLHRVEFLGPMRERFGVGSRAKSSSGAEGYTVAWGDDPSPDDVRQLVCVPGYGQRGVPQWCFPEHPDVESMPGFYDKPRGTAVSVSYGPLDIANIRMQLFRVGRKGRETRVEAHLFSHDAPIDRRFSDNDRTAFLVGEDALDTDTWYRVVFQAEWRRKDGTTVPVSRSWWFQTRE
ncbi:MAG: hypothetical protein KDB80_14560 [Planctomycetes bacterium]|nr:hypothetical protein [Planctomycetota bacterium]